MEAEIKVTKKDKSTVVSSFDSIILSEKRNDEIMQRILRGNADKDNIRPTAWKLYLDVLPKDSSIAQWIEIVFKQRAEYKQKKIKYLSAKKLSGDPLGANTKPKQSTSTSTSEAGWDSFFNDKDIQKEISKDIKRTCQEVDIFHQSTTVTALSNILFIWTKENMDISYKQGMHDLIALLYMAFYPYYINNSTSPLPSKEDLIKHATEDPHKYSDELYQLFHDENELQCDIYHVFTSLMKRGMKELYISKPKSNTNDERNKVIGQYQLFNSDWLDGDDKDIPLPLNIRALLIIKEKLRVVDDELCCHLKYIKLNTYAILQRWLKCIFIREFTYTESFLIWDHILANQEPSDKYGLMYMDYLAIAMHVRVRDQLLQGDENECMTIMFHYPHIDNLLVMLDLASRIKTAIGNKLSGKQIKLSDVLPNYSERQLTTNPIPSSNQSSLSSNSNNSGIGPSTSYQTQTQTQTQAQSESMTNEGYTSNYNPIQSPSSNQTGIYQMQSDSNQEQEPETNQMKSLFSNAWNSVGGFVTDIKSQVSKQIEKVITDDRFNIRQQFQSHSQSDPQSQSQFQSQSTSYPVNLNQSSEAIKILDKLYTKYQLRMDQSDQADFAAAIEYFKNKQ